MALISVDEALDILSKNVRQLGTEMVPTAEACGRVTAKNITANLIQPPFDSSAMDGFAVRAKDCAINARLELVGTSAAGARFDGTLEPNQAVRIFTGAPVPQGADSILIQENATLEAAGDTQRVKVNEPTSAGRHIRPKGNDFSANDIIWSAHKPITPHAINLIAAANVADIDVFKRPKVAILSTGDELVPLGQQVGADQIVASNNVGLKALFESWGAQATSYESATDKLADLIAKLEHILADAPDMLITIGGVSVGDKDLVAEAYAELDVKRHFHGVAVRPGKPLFYGQLRDTHILGLPGNPISALSTAHIFAKPLMYQLMGLEAPQPLHAILNADLNPNGPRQFYMRARLKHERDGTVRISPADTQDSAHLSSFVRCDALLIRPAKQAAVKQGKLVAYLPLS